VDLAVFDFVNSVANNTFKPGTKAYNLSNDGVGFATSGGHVDDIKAKLETYKADIKSGKITVPVKP
jgi:basic membrane lipoprotein Med (substrate-binding protein (PBP1-ABC) superfamily)